MADIELVIKIPHYVYITVVETGKLFSYHLNAARAIKDGIVLPKGHGRIIAEPTEGDIAKTVGGQSDFAECIRDSVKAVFDNAPTIIGADKAESEEKDDIEAMLDYLWNDTADEESEDKK